CCSDACISFPRLRGEPPSLAKNSVVPEGRMRETFAQNPQPTIRHPGESRDPVTLLLKFRHPCLFLARLPGGRATFLCVAKERWPKERPPRCCAFRPSVDERCDRAGRACRRAIPGAAASGRNPLRPPCGPDRPALTAAQG